MPHADTDSASSSHMVFHTFERVESLETLHVVSFISPPGAERECCGHEKGGTVEILLEILVQV